MSSSLKIRNLNEKRADSSPISHEFMPQPPFRMIVCGASHSGKSNMIKNMITVPEYGYKQHFGEDVFVFSRTLGLDTTWQGLNLPKTHMYQKWDESVVREIMAYSKKKKNGRITRFTAVYRGLPRVYRGLPRFTAVYRGFRGLHRLSAVTPMANVIQVFFVSTFPK